MNDIGLIGLGVMGTNLALNIEDKGYSVSIFNHTSSKMEDFINNQGKGHNFSGFYDIEGFVSSLERPRKIILMIKPGEPVDSVIEQLLPHIEEGDLIMDCGNTYFPDTTRRMNELKEKGILYLGVGVSGGESGALHGPSIMPGGSREAYRLVEDLLVKIAANTEDGRCCSYVGDGAAGHFVKMIHNGIEYGMMQAISEAYDIMRKVTKLSSEEIAERFEMWNEGGLSSYLMEISYKIMKVQDDETNKPIVDVILDKAGQKGTGKWTAQMALELGIPSPSLSTAVESREISFFKEERKNLSNMVLKNAREPFSDSENLLKELEKSLLFTNFILFSQGIWVISEASKVYNFNIDISEVLRIWKGGCIIRAEMLDFFGEIIDEDNENVNLLNNKKSLTFLMEKVNSIKYISNIAMDYYVPTFAFHTALDYFYSMVEENLPANLIQAQRDFFGAHTYNRIDREGVFHTCWE